GWRGDGELEFAGPSEEVNGFFCDFGVERGFLLEAGQQLAHRTGIEQCSGETVLANLAGFLEDVDILFTELSVGMVSVVRVDELGQAESTRHAGGASADDDDVGRHLGVLDVFERFAKNKHKKNPATDLRGSPQMKPLIRGNPWLD